MNESLDKNSIIHHFQNDNAAEFMDHVLLLKKQGEFTKEAVFDVLHFVQTKPEDSVVTKSFEIIESVNILKNYIDAIAGAYYASYTSHSAQGLLQSLNSLIHEGILRKSQDAVDTLVLKNVSVKEENTNYVNDFANKISEVGLLANLLINYNNANILRYELYEGLYSKANLAFRESLYNYMENLKAEKNYTHKIDALISELLSTPLSNDDLAEIRSIITNDSIRSLISNEVIDLIDTKADSNDNSLNSVDELEDFFAMQFDLEA